MTALTQISHLATDRRGDALQAREPPGREHYFWTDALRGLAAIIVLISHVSLFGLYGYEHTLATYPPTRLLWAGPSGRDPVLCHQRIRPVPAV